MSAEETNAISDADIVDVLYGNDEEYELTISYVLEADKKLILKTSEEKVVDIQKLEKEIGKSNVEQNSDKNEITLTLDDPDKFDFKLFVTKKKPFKLTALNSKGEFIFDKEFNTEDSSARDAFISDDIGWNQTDNFR
ncbi:hypothetical protein BI355_0990 [Companilactobacillus crustorum]|nr:hypothetical protein BI355_0990 [Companilactobacillus crustorum]